MMKEIYFFLHEQRSTNILNEYMIDNSRQGEEGHAAIKELRKGQ